MGERAPRLDPPRRSDRLFITGATGTGKTVLARQLFDANPPPRLVIDPKDDPDSTGGAYRDRRIAVTFRNPPRGPFPPDASMRYTPSDPDDLDAYDAVIAAAFNTPGMVLWADEAGTVFPAAGAGSAARRYVAQGRGRGLGLIALHQRPIEVARVIPANAEHVIAFALYHPDDRDTLARLAGIDPGTLTGEMSTMPRHAFLWYSRRGHVLAVSPPLR